MKFSDLKIGENFLLDGEAYRKTGPFIAAKLEGGGNKPMRRSQAVGLVDDTSQNEVNKTPTAAVLDDHRTKVLQLIRSHCPQADESALHAIEVRLSELTIELATNLKSG